MSGLVVALAGTDHHPFDRMVQWIDAAAVRHRDVHFLIQHGATRPPLVAEGHEFLSHDRLVAVLAEATAVVCHGGPASSRRPSTRDTSRVRAPGPAARRAWTGTSSASRASSAEAGIVRTVSSLDAFHDALDAALTHTPGSSTALAATRARDAARAQIAAELDDPSSVSDPAACGRRRVLPREPKRAHRSGAAYPEWGDVPGVRAATRCRAGSLCASAGASPASRRH